MTAPGSAGSRGPARRLPCGNRNRRHCGRHSRDEEESPAPHRCRAARGRPRSGRPLPRSSRPSLFSVVAWTCPSHLDRSQTRVEGRPIKEATLEQYESGGVLLSHTVSHAVPSALKSLTTGFGMGPGVSPPPKPPNDPRTPPAPGGRQDSVCIHLLFNPWTRTRTRARARHGCGLFSGNYTGTRAPATADPRIAKEGVSSRSAY